MIYNYIRIKTCNKIQGKPYYIKAFDRVSLEKGDFPETEKTRTCDIMSESVPEDLNLLGERLPTYAGR